MCHPERSEGSRRLLCSLERDSSALPQNDTKGTFSALFFTLCLCASVPLCSTVPAFSATYNNNASTVTVTADYMEYIRSTSEVKARGNVEIRQEGLKINANEVEANSQTGNYHAQGQVKITDEDSAIWGNEIYYYQPASTGTINNGGGKDPPWFFTGRKINLTSRDQAVVVNGYITSCDANPPHYTIHARRYKYHKKVRATGRHVLFYAGDVPLFYTPVYTRSLKDRRYNLDLEPGHNARDGFTDKLVFGYPLTVNTYSRLYWDFFQRTGNGFGAEYNYFLPAIKGSAYVYTVNDTNPDPAPEFRKWTVRTGHWQKITANLSAQTNLNFQSDQTFNDLFFKDNFVRIVDMSLGVRSDAALTYQFPWATARMAAGRVDNVRPSTGKMFADTISFPSLSLTTTNIRIKKIPYFANFSGSFNNVFHDADGFYRQDARIESFLSRSLRISRYVTVKPSLGVSESWLDRSPAFSTDTKDLFVTRLQENTNIRWRATRILDVDFTHFFVTRFKANGISQDTPAADRGLEAHSLNLVSYFRPAFWYYARTYTRIDLRPAARNTPAQFNSLRQRFDPVTLDVGLTLAPGTEFFFRESYQLYTAPSGARRPHSTLIEVKLYRDITYFSATLSKSLNRPGTVAMTHSVGFNLTQGWWVEGLIRYEASGNRRFNFNRVKTIEEGLKIKRAIHCWEARIELLRREPNVSEIFFTLKLKTDVLSRKKLYRTETETEFYPWRQ